MCNFRSSKWRCLQIRHTHQEVFSGCMEFCRIFLAELINPLSEECFKFKHPIKKIRVALFINYVISNVGLVLASLLWWLILKWLLKWLHLTRTLFVKKTVQIPLRFNYLDNFKEMANLVKMFPLKILHLCLMMGFRMLFFCWLAKISSGQN